MRNTQAQSRLSAMLGALTLCATAASLVTAAPHAHAGPEPSDAFYLDILDGLPVSDRFTKQTLLQEGHKTCGAMQHGASEDTATGMVQSDLHVSTYDAYRLVAAVELGLACFSGKTHGQ